MNPGDRTENARRLEPEQWVNRYGDALYSFVCSRIADTTTAQDIVQEIFMSAWRAREGYKGESSEKNWLFAICKNKIIDHYRKEARDVVTHLSTLGIENESFSDGHAWDLAMRPVDWGISYNETIEKKEFYKILELCKNKLQELQRAVFALKYMDDMDSDEICKELEISSSNYWTLMHRAKLQLRGCIDKNWFNLG
jgi:RNA polymerase sigma-70 factor (TIGR02943 family)